MFTGPTGGMPIAGPEVRWIVVRPAKVNLEKLTISQSFDISHEIHIK
jgi:hypothetical protein